MNAKHDRLFCTTLVLALILLVPLAETLPVQVDAGSEADLAAATRDGRLYAAISNDVPAGLLQAHLLDEPNSLKHLAASTVPLAFPRNSLDKTTHNRYTSSIRTYVRLCASGGRGAHICRLTTSSLGVEQADRAHAKEAGSQEGDWSNAAISSSE